MTFEENLEEYRKLIQMAVKGEVDDGVLRPFLRLLNVQIEAYSRFCDELKRKQFQWEKDTRMLCDLRNDLQKFLTREKEE